MFRVPQVKRAVDNKTVQEKKVSEISEISKTKTFHQGEKASIKNKKDGKESSYSKERGVPCVPGGSEASPLPTRTKKNRQDEKGSRVVLEKPNNQAQLPNSVQKPKRISDVPKEIKKLKVRAQI